MTNASSSSRGERLAAAPVRRLSSLLLLAALGPGLAARAQKQVEAAARAGMATNLELSDADNRRFLASSAAAQARATVEIRRAELAAAEGHLAALIHAE